MACGTTTTGLEDHKIKTTLRFFIMSNRLFDQDSTNVDESNRAIFSLFLTVTTTDSCSLCLMGFFFNVRNTKM